jgi:hypothetical protein
MSFLMLIVVVNGFDFISGVRFDLVDDGVYQDGGTFSFQLRAMSPRRIWRRSDTGKLVKGEIMPMHKKAWAAKFKKFARLAGVNEPKKNCHGVRKARAEVAAYSECTEAQMMAMFGWRDNKMPALYIAKASREKLAISGMEKIEAYDQIENIADLAMPIDQNRIVTFESNRRKKP